MGLSRICRTDSGLLPISRIMLRCISCKLLAPEPAPDPPGAANAVMPESPLKPANDPNGLAPERPSDPKGLAAASLPAALGAAALLLPPGDGADVEPDGDAGLPVPDAAGEAMDEKQNTGLRNNGCSYRNGRSLPIS